MADVSFPDLPLLENGLCLSRVGVLELCEGPCLNPPCSSSFFSRTKGLVMFSRVQKLDALLDSFPPRLPFFLLTGL